MLDASGDVMQTFAFDHVFAPTASQEDVYSRVALPVVKGLFQGYNGTVLAYGQTSAGKTYTMEGPRIDEPDLRGVIPRMVDTIFNIIADAPNELDVTLRAGAYLHAALTAAMPEASGRND